MKMIGFLRRTTVTVREQAASSEKQGGITKQVLERSCHEANMPDILEDNLSFSQTHGSGVF